MADKLWTLKYYDWLRVARIALAASNDEQRPILGCLQLAVSTADSTPAARRGKLVAAATDGMILAVNAVDIAHEGGNDWEICVPAAEVAAVTKLVTTEIKRNIPTELRSQQNVHLVTSEDVEGVAGLQLQYVHSSLLDDNPKVDYYFEPVTSPHFPGWEPLLSMDEGRGKRRWSCNPALWTLLASTVDSAVITMETSHTESAAHFSTPDILQPLWRGVIMPLRVDEIEITPAAELPI